MGIERVGKAIGASLVVALVLAAVVVQGLNPCGAELSPCPIQPGPELERISAQLKAIIPPRPQK